MVSTARFTGVGTLTGRTLSGTAYTVPTADFQSTVTAGGEQYIVNFKVTESPTGGNAVHSVDVVRVLKPEFNAQYDQNVTANGNGVPTGISPSLESGGGEGYNGSSEKSADGSDGTGEPGAEGAGSSQIRINKAQGDAFEQAVKLDISQTQNNIVQQITVKTQSGVRTRLDLVGTDMETGRIILTEAKSSQTAPLTINQRIAFPEIAHSGATVVGNGKTPFIGGTLIPPTQVNIVRPR